jgi:hypothetical protein
LHSVLDLKPPKIGPLGAHAKGVQLLRSFRRTVLLEQMRAADDAAHATRNETMRDTMAVQLVSEEAIDACKPLTAADVAADPSWLFAPVVVLSLRAKRAPRCA